MDHRALCAGSFAHHTALGMDPYTRMLQFAAHNFDAFCLEVFATLMAGGCACIPSEAQRNNDLAGAINNLQINTAVLVPTVAELLSPDAVPGLATLALGGEKPDKGLIDMWSTKVNLFNIYGPAECTTFCTFNTLSKFPEIPTRIGSKIENCQVWLTMPWNNVKLHPLVQ